MAHSNRYNFSQALIAKNYLTEQVLLLETQRTLIENIRLTKASLVMLHYINQLNDFPLQLTMELKNALETKASNGVLIDLYAKIHQALLVIKAKRSPEE